MSNNEKDEITGNILEGVWKAKNGKFSADFDDIELDGTYKYKSKAKNGYIKAKIFDDEGDKIGFYKADYDAVSSYTISDSGTVLLDSKSGAIELFDDGDLFAYGRISNINQYL